MTAPRFELSGPMTPSGPPGPGNPSNPPLLILTYNANDTFNPQTYLDQGYTRFDVIAIGGGGGGGGFVDATIDQDSVGNLDATPMKNPGGAGGGGGLQYLKRGYLALLPASCPIVVGAGGAKGLDKAPSQAANTTDGGDGGASSFNGTACQASGGKGGKANKTATLSGYTLASAAPGNNPLADGGAGGIGGSTVAGGGGAGGIAAKVSPSFAAGVAATPGSWNPTTGIGAGGGGGAGGISNMGSQNFITQLNNYPATNGAGGSFSATDLSVYSPGSNAGADSRVASGPGIIIPGFGGGGKAAPITGLSTTYGDSRVSNLPTSPGALTTQNSYGYNPASPGGAQAGKAGVVIVRLTAS